MSREEAAPAVEMTLDQRVERLESSVIELRRDNHRLEQSRIPTWGILAIGLAAPAGWLLGFVWGL